MTDKDQEVETKTRIIREIINRVNKMAEIIGIMAKVAIVKVEIIEESIIEEVNIIEIIEIIKDHETILNKRNKEVIIDIIMESTGNINIKDSTIITDNTNTTKVEIETTDNKEEMIEIKQIIDIILKEPPTIITLTRRTILIIDVFICSILYQLCKLNAVSAESIDRCRIIKILVQ